MKRKISSIWRVTIALVLALSLGLVMAVPAAASPDLAEVSITVNPPTATATAEYQVDFFVQTGLTDEVNCFVIEFPAGTTVPPATVIAANVEIYDITTGTAAQVPDNVVVDGQVVYVYMPTGGPGIAAFHYGRVIFLLAAGIQNPTATGVEQFCAWVYSDEEPTPVQACYDIYETVPIDVYLKYQIPPVECGYVVDTLVDTFVTIGDALKFVEKLYNSGETAVFDVKGTVHNITTPWYGDMTIGTWTASATNPIEDTLSADTITTTDAADETFTVTYNESDGTPTASIILTIASNGTPTWTGGAPIDVVDVVSVTGGDPGATAGYQAKFNLTGDTWNNTAGDYGNWGITTAGTFTDGTSLGEAFTVDVTTLPAANPETYKATYISDDASGTHYAALTILTDGTEIWSPAGVPTNIVDIQFAKQLPAWEWYAECPSTGGLIGARVLVADGTYAETITIGTPGVMVESVNGAASTIIDATGLTPAGLPATMHAAAVMIAAEGVTFGGTGKGFTVKNAGVGVDAGGIGLASVLWADDNSDGIADVSGVYIWPNGGTHSVKAAATPDAWCRVNVIDNVIYGSQARGIRADAGAGTFSIAGVCVYAGENTVYDNLFEGFSGEDLSVGPTWLDPGYTYVPGTGAGAGHTWGYTAIVDNEFYQNGGSGMGTWEYEGAFTTVPGGWKDAGIEICSTVVYSPSETCYIVGNDIHDNVHSGINLLANAAVDALVIKQNAIYDNGIFGISNSATTDDSATPPVINVDCRHNDIYGNTHWGIKNFVVDKYFEAKENYWGALGGPSCGPAPIRHESCQRSDALGNGNAVSHWVYYNPWLSVSFVTVVGEGIRYYGSDTLTLQAGWNTLSVPLALYSLANTLTEIKDDLGDFLTTANWAMAYQYDPAVPGWVSPTTLVPGRGYYIKMISASRFPVLYSNSLGLPAYSLGPMWNLIGSAFGIDEDATNGQGRWGVAEPTVDTEDAEMQVGTALNSISGQASVVVSPSVPGQIATWSLVYDSTEVTLMYTGEAYWVFMTGTGTVAGFEITPFYFTPPAIP